MKKNPLLFLLAISGLFYLIFLAFVFATMGNIVKDRVLIGHGGVNVGVVKLPGVIMDSQKTLKELKEFEEDSSVKAVLLRIDSPGGAVGPPKSSLPRYNRESRWKTPRRARSAATSSKVNLVVALWALYTEPRIRLSAGRLQSRRFASVSSPTIAK